MIKKYLLMIILSFIAINLRPKGFDFSAGGSYQIGLNYSFNNLSGCHQLVTIPVIFSYYPGHWNLFSIGARNKIGYGITLYQTKKSFNTTYYDYNVNFDSIPIDHEVYENLSFIIKAGGQYARFMLGLGCSFKYNFVHIPDGNLSLSFSNPFINDPKIDFYLITPGDYNFFSVGPTFDFNLEIIDSQKFQFYNKQSF